MIHTWIKLYTLGQSCGVHRDKVVHTWAKLYTHVHTWTKLYTHGQSCIHMDKAVYINKAVQTWTNYTHIMDKAVHTWIKLYTHGQSGTHMDNKLIF